MKSLEIIISATVAFALGFIWYEILFKGHWTRPTDSNLQPRIKVIDYALIFLSMCVVSFFMNHGYYETHINGGNLGHGIFHGGLYALSYAIPVIFIHHIYQKKSLKQLFVDAGYALIFFGTIGGMLALLPLKVY